MARCFAVAMSQAPGLSGTPDSRPPLERRDERVLRQILGRADVAHDPGEARDQPGATRSARPRRWRDVHRKPSRLPVTPASPAGARPAATRLAPRGHLSHGRGLGLERGHIVHQPDLADAFLQVMGEGVSEIRLMHDVPAFEAEPSAVGQVAARR